MSKPKADPAATAEKIFPRFESDAHAERFVDEADLSKFDFSSFKPMHFELQPKSRQINLRMPEALVAALKARAKERNIPYQKLIREAIEAALR